MAALRADLAVIETLVARSDVLYDQRPLAAADIVVDTDPSVGGKGKQPDGKWVYFVMLPPDYLQVERERERREREAVNCLQVQGVTS